MQKEFKKTNHFKERKVTIEEVNGNIGNPSISKRIPEFCRIDKSRFASMEVRSFRGWTDQEMN